MEFKKHLILTLVMGNFMGGFAFAQELSSTENTGDNAIVLKSQVVSANKFDQNIKEIDGSILSTNAKELQDLHIQTTQDLSKVFPGFILKASSGSAYTFGSIRGISSTDQFNPSLAIYVDGIPQDPAFLTQELLNIKRVELLRGPQGSIWGQNAQAGVLNIISNPITNNTASITGSSSIGMLSKNIMLDVSTPILKDWLYVGGNLAYNRYSGQIKGEKNGERLDTSDSVSGNAEIAFKPKDSNFLALFKYSASDLNDHHNGFFLTKSTYETLEVDDRDKVDGIENKAKYFIPLTKRNVQSYALKLQYDFKKSTLNNVLSYQDSFYDQNLSYGSWAQTRGTITDELRFNTKYDNGGYSIFGLYFQNIDNKIGILDYAKTGAKNGQNKSLKNVLALYGEGKTPSFYGLDMTFGLRYSFDASRVDFSGTSTINPYTNTYNSNIFTPKIALGYDVNENIRLYVLYQNGYKAGGFNFYTARASDSDPIKPEYTQNAEIGLHSSYNKIAFDISAYYIYITDKQVYIGPLGQQSLKNIGSVDSKGLEVNVQYTPIEALKLSFGGTFGHSRYVSGYDSLAKVDFKNHTLGFAPDVTMNASVDFAFLTLDKSKFFINLNGNFYSKMYFNETNTLYQAPYALLDASLRAEINNDLSVNFYVQNIFNQKYLNYAVDYGSEAYNQYIIGDRRNIGISLAYRL